MTGHLPADVELSLEDVLEPGEVVLGAVTTLAGTLVLSERHIVIVRSLRGFRPQSGIRSWEISPSLALTCGSPRGGMGRVLVGDGVGATSFFVRIRDWDDAVHLVTMAHGIAYRAGSAPVGVDQATV